MGDRIVTGGILGDAGQYGTFGKIQFGNTFSEVTAGSCLNTIGSGSQIDGVEIIL